MIQSQQKEAQINEKNNNKIKLKYKVLQKGRRATQRKNNIHITVK